MTETTELTEAERARLREIAAMIVPASEEFAMPGADDPDIFAGIIADSEARISEMKASAMAEVDMIAKDTAEALVETLVGSAKKADVAKAVDGVLAERKS